MIHSLFPIIKRYALYPSVVGYLAYSYFRNTFNYEYGTDFFLVKPFTSMIPLDGLSDQFYYAITFYLFGYMYGLISSVYGVRKFKRGIVLSLMIWVSKIVVTMVVLPLSPLVFVINIFVSAYQVLRKNNPRARLQYADQ